MKIVTLAAPTSVDTGNPPRGFAELRQPVEGSLIVSDEEAARLQSANLLAEEPTYVPEGDLSETDEATADDLDNTTVADLHILATKEGVPLGDATKKADIAAAIRKHRTEKAA